MIMECPQFLCNHNLLSISPHVYISTPHTRTVPENLFNFTLGACLNCCVRSKGQEEPPSPSPDDNAIADIKMKLKFYFMNPFEKWKFRDKRRFPWKLFMQLASIILVTWQVLSYNALLSDKDGITLH